MASVLSVVAVLGANSVGHENIAEVRLYANYLVVYGVAAVIWVCLFWKGKTLYNKEYWKLSLSLSIPLIGYSIAAQILSVSDRMISISEYREQCKRYKEDIVSNYAFVCSDGSDDDLYGTGNC